MKMETKLMDENGEQAMDLSNSQSNNSSIDDIDITENIYDAFKNFPTETFTVTTATGEVALVRFPKLDFDLPTCESAGPFDCRPSNTNLKRETSSDSDVDSEFFEYDATYKQRDQLAIREIAFVRNFLKRQRKITYLFYRFTGIRLTSLSDINDKNGMKRMYESEKEISQQLFSSRNLTELIKCNKRRKLVYLLIRNITYLIFLIPRQIFFETMSKIAATNRNDKGNFKHIIDSDLAGRVDEINAQIDAITAEQKARKRERGRKSKRPISSLLRNDDSKEPENCKSVIHLTELLEHALHIDEAEVQPSTSSRRSVITRIAPSPEEPIQYCEDGIFKVPPIPKYSETRRRAACSLEPSATFLSPAKSMKLSNVPTLSGTLDMEQATSSFHEQPIDEDSILSDSCDDFREEVSETFIEILLKIRRAASSIPRAHQSIAPCKCDLEGVQLYEKLLDEVEKIALLMDALIAKLK